MDIQETKLDNNIRVFTNKMSGATASIGAFINVGSRNETEKNNGVAHFLEHLAFKGTPTRSAKDISQQVEILGASSNASTDYSETAYYVRGLADHLPIVADIIGDILTNSIYDESDIKTESAVILQEIAQYEDDATTTMITLINEVAYPNQPLGRQILGTKQFVSNAKSDDFRNFIDQNYSGQTMIVVASGGIDHSTVTDIIAKSFAGIPVTASHPPVVPASYSGGLKINNDKKFSQANIGIMFPSVPACDHAFFSHKLLAQAFGGGMSSPLFMEVREKRGLVYHTSAFATAEKDHGKFVIIGMMTPENIQEFIQVSCAEFTRMTHTINEQDLERAKNSLLVNMAYGQENASSMMAYIAKSVFVHDRVRSFEEVRTLIEDVTIDDLKAAANRLLAGKPSIALVGPVPDADYEGMVQTALGQ